MPCKHVEEWKNSHPTYSHPQHWVKEISFTPQLLYPHVKSTATHSKCGQCENEKNLRPCQDANPDLIFMYKPESNNLISNLTNLTLYLCSNKSNKIHTHTCVAQIPVHLSY